jgi:thiamine kinase-like enzyme
MTDRYTSIAGPTMHTGWMKKISLLEQQMLKALRDITELQKQVKELQERPESLPVPQAPWSPYNTLEMTLKEEAPAPVKRGPGRPRKNP